MLPENGVVFIARIMPEPVVLFSKIGLPELETVAEAMLRHLPPTINVIAFKGDMGAGKTTFIKALAKVLGVTETVTSPTYSLVNEYEGKGKRRICHFDFYRIRNEQEAEDIGTSEYFSSGDLCLVEWPSEIPNLLPDHFAEVLIEAEGNEERSISLTIY